MITSLDTYLSAFDELESRLGRRHGYAEALRREGLEAFTRLGFPTLKGEDWRYTPLKVLAETRFGLSGFEGRGLARQLMGEERASSFELVFVNGHYDGGLSSRRDLPAGTTAENLADVLLMWPGVLQPHLGRYARVDASAFTALNAAFLEDGAFIHVPRNVEVPRPISLCFVSTPGRLPTASHPRNLIVLDPHSRAIVVERFEGEGRYLSNAVTEVVLGEGARLDYYLLVDEDEAAFHVGRVQVEQGPNSRFMAHAVTVGGALARTELHVRLAAEGAGCELNGLYIASGQQHVDTFTRVEHASPGCTSRELFKGILDARATGVFNGQVVVREDAQRTDAQQINKNLLLSDDAVVDARPQLAISADDVKCAHGAAVGQLDADQLFYLRARGVPEEEARALLTRAFAREVVELIRYSTWRERVDARVEAALPGGADWRAAS